MSIKSLKIENIRGIQKKEIKANIYPNTPTFFVAPNGFGKTSIATAFNSIKRDKIDVIEENKYLNNKQLKSSIEIVDDQGTYVATSMTNTISSEYSIFVINSQIKPQSTNKNLGNFVISKSALVVEPIILYKKIPDKEEFIYSFSDMKKFFENSAGKLLINLKVYLNQYNFVLKLVSVKGDLEKLQTIKNIKILKEFINKINKKSGEKTQIMNFNIGDDTILNKNECVNIIKELDFLFSQKTDNEKIVNIFQLIEVYKNNIKSITKIKRYYEFLKDKSEIDDMLSFVNCTWKNIKTCKRNSSFLINFPKANDISNGERDILCFIGKLFEASIKLNKHKNILIIDEIFDYLDDANLISAQYFIVKLINKFESLHKEVYPIILTHLDPMYFNTYNFSTKNVVYLDKITQIENKYKINNLLKDRTRCSREEKETYDIISSNYLHYSIKNEEAIEYLERIKVDSVILQPEAFREKCLQELFSYKRGEPYDLALVCCGLRIFVEKEAYAQLDGKNKEKFIATYKTVDKLKFAKEEGAKIPEVYFLLSIIYNEAMHLDSQCQKLNPIACKLKNKVIKRMICETVN